MMDNRQNAVNNSDVVDAINDLGKTRKNIGNTSYVVGDVTCDETSGTANAVRELTRAVIVEGRR